MKVLAGLILYLITVLGACALEIISIIGMFNGSHMWAGIFGIMTFLNVRGLALKIILGKNDGHRTGQRKREDRQWRKEYVRGRESG